jgi:hypoxanthine phosphoribosyltransferase
MTMQEALAEIERIHPGGFTSWTLERSQWDKRKAKPVRLPKTEMAYWYYCWKRQEYEMEVILETQDEMWQLL